MGSDGAISAADLGAAAAARGAVTNDTSARTAAGR